MSVFWAPLAESLYENYESFCLFLGRSESRNPGFDVRLGYAQSSADLWLPEENTNKLKLVGSLHAFLKVVYLFCPYFSVHLSCKLQIRKEPCSSQRVVTATELLDSMLYGIEHPKLMPSNSANTQERKAELLLTRYKYF